MSHQVQADTRKHREHLVVASESEFALAMQQAEQGSGDQRRRVRLIVYVSRHPDMRRAKELATIQEEYWRPPSEGGLPFLSKRELAHQAEAALADRPELVAAGYIYAQARWTSGTAWHPPT